MQIIFIKKITSIKLLKKKKKKKVNLKKKRKENDYTDSYKLVKKINKN